MSYWEIICCLFIIRGCIFCTNDDWSLSYTNGWSLIKIIIKAMQILITRGRTSRLYLNVEAKYAPFWANKPDFFSTINRHYDYDFFSISEVVTYSFFLSHNGLRIVVIHSCITFIIMEWMMLSCFGSKLHIWLISQKLSYCEHLPPYPACEISVWKHNTLGLIIACNLIPWVLCFAE